MKKELVVKCETVRGLMDGLTELLKDERYASVLDAYVETVEGYVCGFKISQRTLTDNSQVFDFELLEDN